MIGDVLRRVRAPAPWRGSRVGRHHAGKGRIARAAASDYDTEQMPQMRGASTSASSKGRPLGSARSRDRQLRHLRRDDDAVLDLEMNLEIALHPVNG